MTDNEAQAGRAGELADKWASEKYEKRSKMPGREYTGAYLDGVEDFLAGYHSRDAEVAELAEYKWKYEELSK